MEESKGKKFSNWMQDNLQAIIIIAIALFILFFLIYSYSKKSNTEDTVVDDTQQEEIIDEIPADTQNTDSSSEIANSNSTNTESVSVNSENNQNTVTTSTDNSSTNLDRGKGPYTTTQTETNTNSQQQTRDGVITVTASYGESLTHLARKATAQYISENNVEGLTPAHKIYVEDALQRSVSNKTVTPGTSVSFSNESISTAIDSANSLNDYQLKNLNGYANYVSGL